VVLHTISQILATCGSKGEGGCEGGGCHQAARRLTPSSAVNLRRSSSDMVPFIPPVVILKTFCLSADYSLSSRRFRQLTCTCVIAAIVKISSPHLNSSLLSS
jgi:hypothetical protein